jgi:hypothetical protein
VARGRPPGRRPQAGRRPYFDAGAGYGGEGVVSGGRGEAWPAARPRAAPHPRGLPAELPRQTVSSITGNVLNCMA